MKYFRTIIPIVLIILSCCKKTPQQPSKEEQQRRQEEIKREIARKMDNKIVLRIEEKTFTNQDFKNFISTQYSELSSKTDNSRLTTSLFKQFIEHNILLYKVEQENLKLDDTETADYIQKMNLSMDQLDKNSFENNIKIQKYLYHILYKNITVTDREIRNYYNQNAEEFRKKEEVLVYQILLKNKDKAEEIRGTLINYPQRFGQLAKKESKAQGVKEDGQMGYFEKGILPKNMEEVIFSLKVGEISPIVESPYGYHIFLVTRKKRGRLLYLSSVKEEIRDKLLADRYRTAYQDFVESLKHQLKIETYQENIHVEKKSNKGETENEI